MANDVVRVSYLPEYPDEALSYLAEFDQSKNTLTLEQQLQLVETSNKCCWFCKAILSMICCDSQSLASESVKDTKETYKHLAVRLNQRFEEAGKDQKKIEEVLNLAEKIFTGQLEILRNLQRWVGEEAENVFNPLREASLQIQSKREFVEWKGEEEPMPEGVNVDIGVGRDVEKSEERSLSTKSAPARGSA